MTQRDREHGVALVVCTLAMLLLMAIGAALLLATSAETLIASNFRTSHEGAYAAAAALERAISDLRNIPDWNHVLDGAARSDFVDGPAGIRTLSDGSTIDLAQIVNMANCGRTAMCTDGQMDAVTSERPWGTNNPRWQLFAHGPLSALAISGSIAPRDYLVVLVADDQAENDGNPAIDGTNRDNPGSSTLVLRGESFGPKGLHRGVEATVTRGFPAVRVLSWRALNRLDHP